MQERVVLPFWEVGSWYSMTSAATVGSVANVDLDISCSNGMDAEDAGEHLPLDQRHSE